MVSHWWKALTGGPTKTEGARRSAPRLESLEGRWVPSASPVTAHLVAATTAPVLTAPQELKIEKAFAARLDNQLHHAQAEVSHDQKDIEADKDRIARLGKDIARVTTAIAEDTNLTVLAVDKKRLAALTTQLDAAKKDLTQDTKELAADKLYASSLKTELTAVRTVIAADLAGAKHDAAYAAKLEALSVAVHTEVTLDTTDLADDKARAVTLAAQLANVNADIAKDTGIQLAADRIIAGRLEHRLHHLQMDVTHDTMELARVNAFSLQLDARLLAVKAEIAASVTNTH